MDFPKQEIFDNESKRTQHYIHNHYPTFEQYLNDHYSFAHRWSEKLYCYYNNITKPTPCIICGRPVKFKSFNVGYREYCSIKCSTNSDEVKNKSKQTNLKKYGTEYGLQSDEVKNKSKQTLLKRYGVENASLSNTIKDKRKQTNLKRYGVECSFQSDITKDKIKQTLLKRYGVEHALQSDIIKNKVKQTNLERYGVEHASQADIIKDKIKQTNLERYGVEHAPQADIIKDKIKQTNLERYGVERAQQADIIKDKINNTKHLNNTFNTSKIEEKFESYLNEQGIKHVRQYKSEKYPFNCDFYILKYDLYIEIQASWTHGGHPYDEEKDKDQLEYWKSKNTEYYKNAVEVWTIRDVKKREIAKLNKLNYLEIFSNDINEVINCFQQFLW